LSSYVILETGLCFLLFDGFLAAQERSKAFFVFEGLKKQTFYMKYGKTPLAIYIYIYISLYKKDFYLIYIYKFIFILKNIF